MNEHDIRLLVREAVERHLGRPTERVREPFSPDSPEKGSRTRFTGPEKGTRPFFSEHSSHLLMHIAAGSDVDEGMCVIEPAVRCSHCRFCRSLGH